MFLNCFGLLQYIIYNRYRCFFCTTVAFFNTLKPHPQPLPVGEGLGVGPFLHKYTEMKLRCERHQITIWKHGFQAAKPRVLGRETKGFRVWNPWFCKWEVSTFKSERKEDENRGDCYYFNKCFVKICKTNKIKKCLKWGSFCINMQNKLYIYAKTSFYEHKGE